MADNPPDTPKEPQSARQAEETAARQAGETAARARLLRTLLEQQQAPPAKQGRPRRLKEGDEFDPEPLRETTRSRIAYALIFLLISVALSLIILTATDALKLDESKDLAAAILSPVIAITGTVFGFYYGGHRGG